MWWVMVLCLVSPSFQNTQDNQVEVEKPLKEAVNNIRNEQNLDNLGGILSNLLESGGKQLLEGVLQNQGEAGQAAGILDAISALAKDGPNNDAEDYGGADLLKGLGSLASMVGNLQGQGDNNPMGLLQGLGSLLSNGQTANGLDQNILGNLASMFTEDSDRKPTKNKSGKSEKRRARKEDDFDLSNMLSMASAFMGDSGKNLFNKGMGDLMPMVIQTIGAFVGPDAAGRADSHSGHAFEMPALFEKAHLFFDHFLHSELGKSVLATIGADKTFKVFLDENGKFSYDKFVELIENHSFRKHWIQKVTMRLIHLIQRTTKDMNLLPYMETGRMMFNSFFKNQGFPTKVLPDFSDPVNSISAFADYFAKVYLDLPFTSKPYVKPAVQYVTDVYQMAKESLGSHREPKELSDKLADTINLDIIEPIVRVNRAYRFAKKTPKCDRYVLCTINHMAATGDETLPGLKKLLTRVNSVILGWFLSSHTQTPFWDLYDDITINKDCKPFYKESCEGFHDEEMKVTTEYVHNEL